MTYERLHATDAPARAQTTSYSPPSLWRSLGTDLGKVLSKDSAWVLGSRVLLTRGTTVLTCWPCKDGDISVKPRDLFLLSVIADAVLKHPGDLWHDEALHP